MRALAVAAVLLAMVSGCASGPRATESHNAHQHGTPPVHGAGGSATMGDWVALRRVSAAGLGAHLLAPRLALLLDIDHFAAVGQEPRVNHSRAGAAGAMLAWVAPQLTTLQWAWAAPRSVVRVTLAVVALAQLVSEVSAILLLVQAARARRATPTTSGPLERLPGAESEQAFERRLTWDRALTRHLLVPWATVCGVWAMEAIFPRIVAEGIVWAAVLFWVVDLLEALIQRVTAVVRRVVALANDEDRKHWRVD